MAEYIEREAVVKLREEFWKDRCDYMAVRVTNIMNIPAADVVEVRHGKWLSQKLLGENAWDCSECKTLGSPQWKWCPICGAKMDGVTDTNVGGKIDRKDNNNA